MKKILMVLMLALTTMAVSAKTQQQVNKNDTVDEVEVFSDTTSIDSVALDDAFPFDDEEDWEEWSSSDTQSLVKQLGVDVDGLVGMLYVIIILIIIFILAPVALIGLILYFIYKNRKDKMRLMEMAIKNGKQIPVDAIATPSSHTNDIWNKGIKQMFLGAGLAFLLWFPLGKFGMAIGALILLIGCGNMVIGHNARQKQKEQEMHDKMFGKSTDSAF